MASRHLLSAGTRIALLTAGTAALTLGVCTRSLAYMAGGSAMCLLSFIIFLVMRHRLKERSWLMLEAIRNRDYSFRLPMQGLAEGERILQDTLTSSAR